MITLPYHLILASNSPRRKELLKGLNIPFEVKVLPNIEENYPSTLPAHSVAEYIAVEKATAYKSVINPTDLVLTADTVVIVNNKVLGKPKNAEEAKAMLHLLSGKTHSVVTGVCLTATTFQKHFSVETHVTFKSLTSSEIDYYIKTFKPFDKAGAYGIQEWIGYIGVTQLQGSYFNVMGLPVQRIWEALQNMASLSIDI